MTEAKVIQRGQIWFARLIGEGSVQSSGANGLGRPVIIISNKMNNTFSPTLSVIPLTSRVKRMLPTHVLISKSSGLIKDSVALAEQILTIDKSQLISYIGEINQYEMQQLEQSILVQLGILEPSQNKKAI